MTKIPAGVIASLAAVLLLAGCSSAPSQAEACATLNEQSAELMTTLGGITAQDVDASEVALEEAQGLVDSMASVDGPGEFVELRDRLVSAMSDFIDEGHAAIAGEPGDMLAVQADVTSATNDLIAYCS